MKAAAHAMHWNTALSTTKTRRAPEAKGLAARSDRRGLRPLLARANPTRNRAKGQLGFRCYLSLQQIARAMVSKERIVICNIPSGLG